MRILCRGLAIAMLAVAGCIPSKTGTTSPEGTGADGWPPGAVAVEVIRVFDGDTVRVRTTEGTLDVRLDGINAPDEGECFYEESAGALRDLLAGSRVGLLPGDRDQFGRTLGHVWADDTNVNLALLGSGHAIATTPLSSIARSLEETAVSSGLGLWGPESCGTGPLPELAVDPRRSVFDPPGPDQQALDQELVVLANNGAKDVSLAGWVLRDESSRHRYRFPDGATIRAGGIITVTSADPGWSPGGSPVWNNDGDIVILLDPSGRVVAIYRYPPGH